MTGRRKDRRITFVSWWIKTLSRHFNFWNMKYSSNKKAVDQHDRMFKWFKISVVNLFKPFENHIFQMKRQHLKLPVARRHTWRWDQNLCLMLVCPVYITRYCCTLSGVSNLKWLYLEETALSMLLRWEFSPQCPIGVASEWRHHALTTANFMTRFYRWSKFVIYRPLVPVSERYIVKSAVFRPYRDRYRQHPSIDANLLK